MRVSIEEFIDDHTFRFGYTDGGIWYGHLALCRYC